MKIDFEGKRQALKDQLQRVLGGIEVLDKLEKEQERTEAKRAASVIEPTGSKQAGSSTSTINQPSSIHEAFESAKRELAAKQ